MTAPHKDLRIIEAGRESLVAMRDVCSSLVYATLLTDDGFDIVSVPGSEHQNERLASMASSIQALGDAVVRELALGTSEFVIIAADEGHVIQRRVPGQPIVLAAVFDTDETLGKALAISRVITEKLTASIRETRVA